MTIYSNFGYSGFDAAKITINVYDANGHLHALSIA